MSTTNIVVAPADNNSGRGIGKLIARVFNEYDNCPFVAEEFSELAQVSDHYRSLGGKIWVAKTPHSAEILGCLAIVPTKVEGTFELFKVYVGQNSRGTGLAQHLYNTGLAWGAERGLTEIRLWTDTRFESGHRFYTKLGFVKQPIIRYLGDVGESWEYLFTCQNPVQTSKVNLVRRDT